MKAFIAVLVAFMAMASAIPPPDSSGIFSKIADISNTTMPTNSTTPGPAHRLVLDTADTTRLESPNQASHLDQRRAKNHARDEEFDCGGVQYFSPEIDVECVVTKRATEASWYYKLDVKIQPAGLAYSKDGLDLWYNHFLTSFLDGWDHDFFEDAVSSPADWQKTWGYEEIGENNWGWGLYVESTDMDSDKVEHDPYIERHLAEHLERIIPKAACGEDAAGIHWKHASQCEMVVKKDEDDKKKEGDDKDDDKKDDDRKDDTTNDEEDHRGRPGGGYRGRGG